MRKWFAVLVVLLGCLSFAGQSAASAAVGYDDCCLQACEGMLQCANAACQSCAVPHPAPLPGTPSAKAPAGACWREAQTAFNAGCRTRPWTPPD